MPYNIDQINHYIDYAISLGVKELKIGVSVPSGRAIKDRRFLYATCKKEIISKINMWADVYSDAIKIDKLPENDESTRYKDLSFHCQAGKTIIVVSEKGNVSPCIMIPSHESYSMSVQKYYYKYIVSGSLPDYSYMLSEMQQGMSQNGFSLFDLECAGFCKIN